MTDLMNGATEEVLAQQRRLNALSVVSQHLGTPSRRREMLEAKFAREKVSETRMLGVIDFLVGDRISQDEKQGLLIAAYAAMRDTCGCEHCDLDPFFEDERGERVTTTATASFAIEFVSRWAYCDTNVRDAIVKGGAVMWDWYAEAEQSEDEIDAFGGKDRLTMFLAVVDEDEVDPLTALLNAN